MGVCRLDMKSEALYTQTLLGLVRGLRLAKKLTLLELSADYLAQKIPCMPTAASHKSDKEVHSFSRAHSRMLEHPI